MTQAHKAAAADKPVFSSGLPSLDAVLHDVLAGDNVVWQVNDFADFLPFLTPFVRWSASHGKRIVYFRFADHPYLVPPGVTVDCFTIDPQAGFETFISDILQTIERYGRGVCYVFDCLSDLAVDWYSDRMLGNFFRIACPYLFDLDTVAYFVLMRNRHIPLAIDAIHNTAQVVIDVFQSRGQLYLQPIKVWNRYSPTLYMLHAWDHEGFHPVTRSAVTSEIMSSIPQPWTDFTATRHDPWTANFVQAVRVLEEAQTDPTRADALAAMKRQLLKMILTREESLLNLSEQYFDVPDLIEIGKRMIGTGLIGGKSVGMLLARAILKRTDPAWTERLEPHDSFFIGSDVFYTFVIQNHCWWERHRLRFSDELFASAETIRDKMLQGSFPADICEQFKHMLNYFGQSPIIVRSSSLLEDAYGNAFSGKYESVFCANQGTPEQRLHDFMEAVRHVYASTLSQDALSYRAHRGLMQKDEQMALLVQRVSGAFYGSLYFPQIAGVGYSFNPFVWNTRIDPSAGVLRLVFGLGTRAVDRQGDDYTRIVAINAPLLRPEMNFDEVRKYTQRIADVLDLTANRHTSMEFEDVAKAAPDLPLDIFATQDEQLMERAKAHHIQDIFPWMLTFERLLTCTGFLGDLGAMLKRLEEAYRYPVDIEFSANFVSDTDYRINLLQCRPFQVSREIRKVSVPRNIHSADTLLRTAGPIIGQGVVKAIGRIVYVPVSRYGHMSMSDRYSLARLIGELANRKDQVGPLMLIGPGRWGTKMPALGIPVSFPEIRNAAVLCEVVAMHEGLTPDISLGTHFFNDLVEMDILYMALYPNRPDYMLNEPMLLNAPNRLAELVPAAARWADAVRVIDTPTLSPTKAAVLHVDATKQLGVVFLTARQGQESAKPGIRRKPSRGES